MNSNVVTLSSFGTKFQSKAIAAILSDRLFLDQTHDIIDVKHFDSESLSWIVDKILWYFHEYKAIPSLEVFKQEIDKLPSNNQEFKTVIVSSLKTIYEEKESDDLQYVKDQYLEFCKKQTLKNAILNSVDKLDMGDYEGIRSVINKALHAGEERNYGHDWISDVDVRLTEESRKVVPTGWSVINELMDGGLGGGELGVVMAPSGVGKSWILTAIGKSAIEQGKNVLTFTLELNEKYLGNRYDSLFTGLEPRELKNHADYLRSVVESVPGRMKIKFYPARSASVNTLSAYINKLQITGFKPDIIIVDYADLMRASAKSGNRYEDLGYVYEELRGLAGELDIPIWTASQTHRSSVNQDIIEADKVAESFQKIMISDFIMSISRKAEDKVNKVGRAHIIKNRFGSDGMTFFGSIDYSAGIIDFHHPDNEKSKEIEGVLEDVKKNVRKSLAEKLGRFKADRNLE